MFHPAHRPRALDGGLRGALTSYVHEVPGSLKEHLSTEELHRVALVALLAGATAFGLVEALDWPGGGSVFPSPADAALASFVFVGILDARRRLSHGPAPLATSTRRRV